MHQIFLSVTSHMQATGDPAARDCEGWCHSIRDYRFPLNARTPVLRLPTVGKYFGTRLQDRILPVLEYVALSPGLESDCDGNDLSLQVVSPERSYNDDEEAQRALGQDLLKHIGMWQNPQGLLKCLSNHI